MHSKSKKNSLQKDVYLLVGALLLPGLLVLPFAQLGQAQEAEGPCQNSCLRGVQSLDARKPRGGEGKIRRGNTHNL